MKKNDEVVGSISKLYVKAANQDFVSFSDHIYKLLLHNRNGQYYETFVRKLKLSMK